MKRNGASIELDNGVYVNSLDPHFPLRPQITPDVNIWVDYTKQQQEKKVKNLFLKMNLK